MSLRLKIPFLILAGALITGLTQAAGATSRKQAVNAGFALNIVRFIEWPEAAFADPTVGLVIGTFPDDPINAELDAAAAKEKFHGRPIQTRRIQALAEVEKCHVVFLSKSESRQRAVLKRAAGKPILVIGEAENLFKWGGHVRLAPDPSGNRFQVSVENLKASGLVGGSQLLQVAAP